MRLRAYYTPGSFKIGLYGSSVIEGKRFVVEPVETKAVEKYEASLPFLEVNEKGEFQDLLDDLWSMGLRPSAKADEYKAQLETMKNHLNDMRALVFKSNRKDL